MVNLVFRFLDGFCLVMVEVSELGVYSVLIWFEMMVVVMVVLLLKCMMLVFLGVSGVSSEFCMLL